jgi:ribosomal protein S18 acetylase RimI-like enzyme
MMMMEVRKASVEDLLAVASLFDAYRVFYKQESNLQASRRFISERILQGDSVILVSKDDDGTLTGFVQLYPLFSSVQMKKLWLLNDLYVDPMYRGLRISIMLIDCAKQLVAETNAAGLILETSKSNTIGNNLYLRTDFKLDLDHNYYAWCPPSAES